MLSSLVKVRPEERLATTSDLNPASSLVTGCGEARGMGYWAATQVKGSSLEIFSVSVADAVLMAEGSTLIAVSPNLQSWNACGGKGLAEEPLGQGHIHRTKRQVKEGNTTIHNLSRRP